MAPPIEVKVRSLGYTKAPQDQRLTFNHECVVGANFSKQKVVQFGSIGSRFERCHFDKLRIDNCNFGAGKEISEYIECSFDGANMRMGPGGYARFVRCSFLRANLREWDCIAVEMIECTFSGRLRKAVFNGTVREDMRSIAKRTQNEFRGNDFSAVKLEDVAFRTGIELSQQRLPSGNEHLYLADAERAIQRARAGVMGWRDLERRQQAMTTIKTLEFELRGGQQQLLLNPSNYFTPATRPANEALFALLKNLS